MEGRQMNTTAPTMRSKGRHHEMTMQTISETPLLPIQPLALPSNPSANEASSSQSHSLIQSPNLAITGGEFNQVHGHHTQISGRRHTNVVINFNRLSSESTSGNSPDSPSGPLPSNETDHINIALSLDQSTQPASSQNQSQEITLQKSNDIYERHLTLKGRGFPLWIPEPNQVLHIGYRRTGIRIGDVGIFTHSGGFSFLFNICLPHDDPVNPRMLPNHFSPLSPPIEATDIEKFSVFNNDSHLASASITGSSTAISGIVFESSASEGAILTMPRGARSEDLANFARFREYAAANVAEWYKFVNGPRGREAKNGDVRLVVGFDKTTSWGIATFSNQTQQSNCRLRFGPSEGVGMTTSARTYTWEYSGIAEVRAGPDSRENDGLRTDRDPPDVQFENQCLFVRTLNVTLTDDVWMEIQSSLGSIPIDPPNSQYPHVQDHPDSNHPHSSNSGTGSLSDFLPSQGTQSGTHRTADSPFGLQSVEVGSDNNPAMFISGPLQNLTPHPSKVLNDFLLAKVPSAKMAITHDDDWSSVVSQHDTWPDPHEVIENILASRNICEENGVVFLQPQEVPNKLLSEGSATSVNRVQGGGSRSYEFSSNAQFLHPSLYPCVATVSEAILADLAETKASFSNECNDTDDEIENPLAKMREADLKKSEEATVRTRLQRAREELQTQAIQFVADAQMAADDARKRLEQVLERSEMTRTFRLDLLRGIQPEVWPTEEEFQFAKDRIQYDPEKNHFAICGRSGSGKSSLVNAFRGLRNNYPDAAPTGVVETTEDIMRYPDPREELPWNRLVWFDCPNTGRLEVPGWQYFNQQGLFIFDAIVLVYDTILTETDVCIIQKCERFKIPLFIVRSKADVYIRNLLHEIGYDEDENNAGGEHEEWQAEARRLFIDDTRKNMETNLRKAGLEMHDVFIVSSNVISALVTKKRNKKTLPEIDEVRLLDSIMKAAVERRYGAGLPTTTQPSSG